MNIYNSKYLSKKSCVEINVTLRKNAQSYNKQDKYCTGTISSKQKTKW